MKRTVLITGSSGIIGTGLCLEFLQNNYEVVGVDWKTNPKLKHDSFIFIQCDLSKEDEIKKLPEAVTKIDILINNAARTDLTFKNFKDITLSDWNEGLKVNLTSYFLLSQMFMPHLKNAKGSIINISSTRHIQSEENTEMYSASKGAIVSLTHAMAVTQKHFVRVNCISPGWIARPDAELRPEDHKQHLSGRVGRPTDISKLALFLASEDSGFITGQDFVVDGGMTKTMIYS